MNKSALLHMIRNVSTLSDQDVEEMEKLVNNFPYCQTAHLLIAKASYDKGSMLSNQKLRKAAAYATNRQLLKKLIYTTDAAIPVTAIAETTNVASHNTDGTALDQAAFVAENQITHLPETKTEPDKPVSAEISEPETQNLEGAEDTAVSDLVEMTPTPTDEAIAAEYEIYEGEAVSEDTTIQPETLSLAPAEVFIRDEAVNQIPEPEPAITEETILLPSFEPAYTLTLSELEEMLQVEKWTSTSETTQPTEEAEPTPEDQPTTAEASNTGQPASPEIIRYELEVPAETEENTLDQTLASFDSYLFKPESDEYFNSELKPATNEEFIKEVYTSNQLGYWMGSSRLGELLQVKDELTHHTPLQFYPDLILEYSKQNYLTPTDPPKATAVNRQFEIIDQFLKANPKLKTFSNEKLRSEPQDDLAFKSTKNTKNLASENLANILVQQGKIKKAIKIYEHLIVKIPEKRTYFAAQIEKLRNQI
ncbi:hypothetical protein HUW51_21920 [Adhaeribacter swui]|uniref:Tetratricopeptide repeat protein n=1 Tax=Adhaeribacter swui TaxID=2086471 RepID=A0A7G7GDL1_9BACT|nr:hypothetical protein [Adhaeribacter swui]QNF35245.1 hypothetical protein HUW51_21920 [Adhaeribacter swui]